MNNSDLVWRLVELVLQKEKDLNKLATSKKENNNNPNKEKQDEA